MGLKHQLMFMGNRWGGSDKIIGVMTHYGNETSPVRFPSVLAPTYAT